MMAAPDAKTALEPVEDEYAWAKLSTFQKITCACVFPVVATYRVLWATIKWTCRKLCFALECAWRACTFLGGQVKRAVAVAFRWCDDVCKAVGVACTAASRSVTATMKRLFK